VGGHCIAIDPWFLTEHSTRCRLILIARDINDYMPNYVLQMVRIMLSGVRDATVTVFGVAYKGNVDDTRETPALKFIKLAKNEGYDVKCYDPYVKEFEFELYGLEEAVRNSDCIVVITDHDIFREIDPNRIAKLMRHLYLIDTRNIMDHERWRRAGFKVKVLGDGRKL
jgi:UDP-N-acetyl-D-mannosaminuronic acid dehydrogenase